MASTLNGFCEDPFWNQEVIWESSWPQFSQCFQDTVLTLVPCGFLLLSAPFYTWCLLPFPGPESSHQMCTKLFIAKLLFLLLVTMTWAYDVIEACITESYFFTAKIFSPLLQIVTMLLSFGFMVAERKNHFVTSGVLFVFWALETLTSIIPFYTDLKLKVYKSDSIDTYVSQARFAFILTEFFLHFWVDKSSIDAKPSQQPCTEAESSFPSRLTFSWITSLVLRGHRHTITSSDIPALDPKDESAIVVPRFFTKWTKALVKAREKLKQRATQSRHAQSENLPESTLMVQHADHTETHADDGAKGRESVNSGNPSLIGTLLRAFWVDVFLSQIWKLFYDSLLLCIPLMVG